MLAGNAKNFRKEQNFQEGATYYYRASFYQPKYLIWTTFVQAPAESAQYDLSGLKPEKGETKPLPASLQLKVNVLTPDKTRVDVTVIQKLPLNRKFNWYTASTERLLCDGSPCRSCDGGQQFCIVYNTMPEAGSKVLEGALLKLLYPTGDIVFVRCDYKPDVGATLGMLASGVPSTDTNRSCRVPDPNTALQAETGKLGIKLYMTYLGKNTSESYAVVGTFRPTESERQPPP